jgi:hypothetical protein
METKTVNNYHYFRMSMKVKLPKKQVASKMYFVCEFPANKNKCPSHRSPTEIIINEDSGGRYGRIIKWERAFSAINWKGRIAYVDSIFGDGQKMRIDDYLLICPATHDSPCPSFEVTDGTRLNPAEVNAVVRLLETITYIPEAERLEAEPKVPRPYLPLSF